MSIDTLEKIYSKDKPKKKVDPLHTYAMAIATWGQVAILLNIGNAIMGAGTFYVVVMKNILPLWAFIGGIVVILTFAVIFVVKWGIPAYYKLQRTLQHIDDIEKRLEE